MNFRRVLEDLNLFGFRHSALLKTDLIIAANVGLTFAIMDEHSVEKPSTDWITSDWFKILHVWREAPIFSRSLICPTGTYCGGGAGRRDWGASLWAGRMSARQRAPLCRRGAASTAGSRRRPASSFRPLSLPSCSEASSW